MASTATVLRSTIKKSFFVSFLSLAVAFSLTAQTEPEKTPGTSAKESQTSPPPIQSSNARPIDPSNMDPSVKPADDFFFYATGGWSKRTEIPPELARWGSFNELTEQNNDALHAIAEKAAKTKADPKTAPEVQKVGDYYASGMDERKIEAMRTKPLQDELSKIENMKDRNDVLKEIAHLHTIGVNAFFNFGSGQDDKDSTREIAQAVQGGLGMPDRDYYTKDDDASKKIRDAYVAHVAKMLTLLGEPAEKAAADAKKILAFETSLAQASRTRVELRDPQKNYNKMTQADLQTLTPDWNWGDFFKEIGLTNPGDIDVHQPDFFKAVNTAFTSTSMDDWKTYLRWHVINAAGAALSSGFVNEDFNFKETTLRGTKQIKPRWK
ncbi:MAG TPA: M13 family metallopeptidase N-terminal domain-containing protein, partial [Chthoniobacterales bacterium]|nr:M13 family metallopeptidase N-terminal domain-containing protein [Chthoniobacterales bacterium]